MIDRVEINVYGGRGGSGAMSFRREKFVPFGGPDGGDGGDGGDVVLVAARGMTTLSDLRKQRTYRAGNGENGKGKSRHGKSGKSLAISVPEGTIIREAGEDGEVELGDLVKDGQTLVAARGGKGGCGNEHFATSIRQAPRFAQDGEPGEEKRLVLDLKLLADVGLLGKPNVGKSTLINSVSAAGSRVDDYPFTTLEPKLGVVEIGYDSFVIADIPGLIEGAHAGHGLGHNFLRHIERTRVLIHIIDGTTQDPRGDFEEINQELFLFNSLLKEKPQVGVVNKIDIPSVRERLPQLEESLAGAGVPVYFISAATGEGVSNLMNRVLEMLGEAAPPPEKEEEQAFKVFRPKPIK
ncbi:MAG: GTPase ObgE [Dehalococcoidia bacterium]